jgi:hypothetical protein
MEDKLSLSVILPIKSSKTKDFKIYFDKAIKSLQNQKIGFNDLIIVHSKEDTLVNFLNEYDFESLTVKKVLWDEEPNFASQINFGVENSESDWVSFFEFDDEYASIWFKNVKKYIDVYPDVNAFMPIVVDTDSKSVYAGFTNEAVFAAQFSQEVGYLTTETLLNYQNFQSSGMVIKREALNDFCGFKPSIKLTFVYEFLLRMTYNSVKTMVIPRIGYKHMNLREGSIFWNYKYSSKKLSTEEVKFWLDTAKKEYFFTNDREVKYKNKEN